MMRLFLIILIFFYSVSAFAGTSPAIVKIAPNLTESENFTASNIQVCSSRDTKFGSSKYKRCIKEYELRVALGNYFRNSDKLKSSSEKVKVETSKTSSGRADYMMFCSLGLSFDEIESEKGVYYMDISCKIINIEENVVRYVTKKRKKVFSKNGLLSAKDLIQHGKDLIDKKFPKANELEDAIEHNIEFTNANFKYIYNDEDKKYADGEEQGKLKITGLAPGYLSKNGLTEFVLTAKQGKFTKDMSKSVKFTDADFKKEKKLSFDYQTYDCQDKKNSDKYFETFNLQIINQLTQEKSVMVKEYKVPFKCLYYYTVTTSKKTTKTLKPIEHYRGIDKDLKSYEEDKDTYYIYVDADNARIVQLHIDSKSTRKIHREFYELNTKSCKYEVKKEDDFIKNMGGSPVLESEDEGWSFDDNTKFYINLPSSDKKVSFTWGSLKKSGRYSKSIKYKDKIPKLAKEIIGKINDMATDYRGEAKNNEGIDAFKSLANYPGVSPDAKCGIKVSLESLLIPPVDGMKDPDVEFKINIRPSTKSEIKILKKRMSIK